MVDLCLTLPREYEVQIIPDELLSTVPPERTRCFSRENNSRLTSSILMFVEPTEGAPWYGVFAEEYGVPPAISRVLSSPWPSRICVVAGGSGFLVDTKDPKRYTTLSLFPITGIVQLPGLNALAFSNLTDALAINDKEQMWSTGRLASDYVRLLSAQGDFITATGWDAPSQRTFPFTIRSKDGIVHKEARYDHPDMRFERS